MIKKLVFKLYKRMIPFPLGKEYEIVDGYTKL